MVAYGGIWQTRRVLVELLVKGKKVVLQRTRGGAKNKKKSITLALDSLLPLAEVVSQAGGNKPDSILTNTVPIGIIDGGGSSFIRVEWGGPYWYGNENALFIKGGGVNECVAIEEQYVQSFARWLLGQWLATVGMETAD